MTESRRCPSFDRLSRRNVLGGVLGVSAALGLSACNREPELGPECEGAPPLNAGDLRTRVALEYLDTAPTPERLCVDCRQYVIAPNPGVCGGCKLIKGLIHPKGTCKAFTPNV